MEVSSHREERAKAHGVYMVLEVIELLHNAGIVCCITGVKALRYYGARRVSSDWRVCVPDSQFVKATRIFDQLNDTYLHGEQILPQPKSLLHTYPRFRLNDEEPGITFGFYIMPASEDFLTDLDDSMIERSKNNIPYPRLEVFAQNLVGTQQWIDLEHLVDGMDLDLEWGYTHLRLGEPSASEIEYVRSKNNKILSSFKNLPDIRCPEPGPLDQRPVDRTQKWKWIIERKQERVPPILRLVNWRTQFRSKDSIDPRLRDDRPV